MDSGLQLFVPAYQPSAYQPSDYQPSDYQPSAYQPSDWWVNSRGLDRRVVEFCCKPVKNYRNGSAPLRDDGKTIVYECEMVFSGISNLTRDEIGMLIHCGAGRVEQ